ncbi:MAG: hypothetical protein M3P06_11545 [Acidobacteriota bacterium]|nr:hypothetical protein [Acidobacteriota bacterium]
MDDADQDWLETTRTQRTDWRDKCAYASPRQQSLGLCAAGGHAWACNPDRHRDYFSALIRLAPVSLAFQVACGVLTEGQ